MAFSFGASTSSTPSIFGGSSTPAFGNPASTPSLFGGGSTPAFGASAPAFGASSTPSIFGSTPAFGAASTPSLFGGFSSGSPSLFGGTSAPAFGSSQPASNAFGFSSGSSLFGAASTSAFGQFGQSGQSQAGFGFGQQSAPSFALGVQPPAGSIATVDNKQLTHYTKWEEINQAGQAQLLEMEKKLSTMKEESRQLEQCARLQDSHKEDPREAEDILAHNLKGLASSWYSDEDAADALNEMVHELLHDTETAVRTFQRSYRWREAAKSSPGQVMMPALRELLSAPVTLPSLYIRKCVAAFQRDVEQYLVMVRELEKLLPLSASAREGQPQGNDAEEFLRSLPAAMLNMRDLLVHTAAKLETLHTRIQDAKDHFLEQQRMDGVYLNPFQEAERKERQSDMVARKAVTLQPAVNVGHTAGPQTTGQALVTASATPSTGASMFGASSSSTQNPFGGSSAAGSLFGQPPGGGFNAFSQLPQAAPSRRTKSRK